MLKNKTTATQSHKWLHTIKIMPFQVIFTTTITFLVTASIYWFPTKTVAQMMPSIVTPDTINEINRINCSLAGSLGIDNGCNKPSYEDVRERNRDYEQLNSCFAEKFNS